MEEDIKESFKRIQTIVDNEVSEFSKTLIEGNINQIKRYIENLINRNKELEKYEKYYETEKVIWSRKDYIPKSKVREKIEEINNEELNFNENDYWIEQEMKGYAIDHIKELLQEGDK